MDIFQRAIDKATAHEQTPVNPKKQARAVDKAARRRPIHHHLASVVLITLAVLLMAGAITYGHRTGITLRYADAKAGFHAKLPGWTPHGFGISDFEYKPGVVTANYDRSGTSRHYSFSQSITQLTSDQLLTDIVQHHKTYQTLQNANRAIFIYGDNNAAWIDEGKLYQITSDGNLTTSDLLSIATSV